MKGLIALSLVAFATAAPTFEGSAPLLSNENVDHIPNSYIIKFKKHVTPDTASDHHSWIAGIHSSHEDAQTELRRRGMDSMFAGIQHTYNLGQHFMGYSGNFDDEVIQQVRSHPDVEYIERDSIVHTMTPVEEEDKCDAETEKNSPWGLARISHRDSLNFGTFNKYLYSSDGGEGVDVYVIDTGCNTEHVDFEGRAHWGKTIPTGDADVDGNGHGTHCSGTIAGHKYGVAKKASVYAVKVLKSNGSGTMSDVVKGVEWAATSHLDAAKAAKDGKRKGFKGSAANMSLGGGKTTALDDVVNAAVVAGVHFSVAAGNDNADACRYSPAAAEKALTVGASALDDSRAYFSNWGKCTDIFAPGLSIQSTWIGSKYAVNTISGTSMASPHICGLLAYYLSLQPAADSEYATEPLTPEKLKADLISVATSGALTDLPQDTPNLLAWNGAGCSNYSQIVEAGGYEVKRSDEVYVELPTTVEEVEDAIEDDFEIVSGRVVKTFHHASGKAERFANKIHDLVEKEIEEFLEEVSV
ncbi:hypothetical protein MKZ38_002478 [Zalerion maritima]|uniref:Uncharacterized protein n=1 Tax=Zalerion maritima TaxID=339359 RepID=A0AAD5RQF5_9PEZI|nr:hypothetical protein MKZ38_002478 [Zalerion maritima]